MIKSGGPRVPFLPKPKILLLTRAVSHFTLHEFALSSNWFIARFTSVVISQSNYCGFRFCSKVVGSVSSLDLELTT